MIEFNYLVYAWIAVAILILPLTLSKTAPYGRHASSRWGPTIDNKAGWIVMELPALLIVPLYYFLFNGATMNITMLFVMLWTLHYFNRTLIYPMRIKTSGKKIPLAIVAFALVFNGINGSINGIYFAKLAPDYSIAIFETIHFWSGLVLFVSGLASNWYHDGILISLRRKSSGYQVPKGGLFKLISCPNLFSEMVEWIGFALMTWSLPALSFAVWTIVNLLPRALDHHKWYLGKFADYPKRRKALIPFVL